MKKTYKILIGVAVSTTAIAFFSRKIYQAYKLAKNDLEALEEAEETLKNYNLDVKQEYVNNLDTFTNSYNEEEEEVFIFTSDIGSDQDSKKINYAEYFESEEIDEEENKLRYPMNSPEAKDQWYSIKMADIHDIKASKLISQAILIPFDNPSCKEDEGITGRIIDEKQEFFGKDSIWTSREYISIGDIILYFAELATFDLGKTIDYFATLFSGNIIRGYNHNEGNNHLNNEIISKIKRPFEQHTLYLDNQNREGMFGIIQNPNDSPQTFMNDYFKFSNQFVQDV